MSTLLPLFSNIRSVKTRLILGGLALPIYYVVLLSTAPDYLLNFNMSSLNISDPSFYTVIFPPVIVVAGVYGPKMPVIIRRFKKSGAQVDTRAGAGANITNQNISGQLLQQIPNTGQTGSTAAQKKVENVFPQKVSPSPGTAASAAVAPQLPIAQPSSVPAAALPLQTPNAGSPAPANVSLAPAIEMIDEKIKPIAEGITSTKNDITNLKKDMDSIKTNLQELNSTFETSLIDLKAFQAEMVNPINFMRKYFDSLDIKNVSDPMSAFPNVDQMQKTQTPAPPSPPKHEPPSAPAEKKAEPPQEERPPRAEEQPQPQNAPQAYSKSSGDTAQATSTISQPPLKGIKNPAAQSPSISSSHTPLLHMSSQDEVDLRRMFEIGLTPGKIMSVVSMIDEILGSMGPDGVDMLVEQYKMLGLKPEDELVIYNVLRMLNDSKVYTDDIIAMLYRFGQILGINDRDAELQYARLIANKNRKASRPRGGVE